jgi:hypothetical protein
MARDPCRSLDALGRSQRRRRHADAGRRRHACPCCQGHSRAGRRDTRPCGGEEQDGGAAPAPGTALLTVGDESYSFEITSCFFPPDDGGKHTTSFRLTATGTVDGARAELGAVVKDSFEEGRLEGNGTSHWVTLEDVEDVENPAVSWGARSGYFADDPFWTVNVDDKHISAEPVFDDGRTEASETIGGTFEAICP